jgi:O-antigen ligase
VVGVALFEVVLGLLQAAGGADSSLNFGAIGGRPLGTFANPNHFANYVALALAAFVWLAWLRLSQSRRMDHMHVVRFRRSVVLHVALAVLLLIGVLMSRSRGAALGGLSAAVAALAIALAVGTRGLPIKKVLLVIGGLLAAGMFLVGFDVILSRFDMRAFAGAASSRAEIASATLEGAAAFWPVGAGWGTYNEVFPRFQPAGSAAEAFYHAHHDYAEMLFEGGIFAVLLMTLFAWLAVTRAVYLVRSGIRQRRLRREEMAAAICGLGLLGFLLHSVVEFNMHIPANAIIASLFAGIFLRPLKPKEEDASGD